MPENRFFTEEDLSTDKEISLSPSESRHLKVMRAQNGQNIELVNGRGQLAQAKFLNISSNQALVQVTSVTEQALSQPNLILCQSIPRPKRLDFILEKGTELGMSEIWLFPAVRSEKKDFKDNQIERMKAITVAAMKQCGSLHLPKITILPHISKWKTFPENSFFGDIEEEAPVFQLSLEETQQEHISFFIGPESGFDDREIALLREKGTKGVKLHPYILRTDTAPIVALSIIQQQLLQKAN